MAKNVKTVNKNARYGNMKNSKKRKHKKRRHILLLTSILMLILTVCWYIVDASYKEDKSKGYTKTKDGQAAQDVIQLKRAENVNRDNSAYSTGNYANVYNYIDTVKPVINNDFDMTMGNDGYYRMAGQNRYSILQLTDIHITGTESVYDKDLKAVQTVYSMIQRAAPDFIILTGDVIFGTDDYDANDGIRALNVISTLMDKIGIPWTWCFGNHDHSFFDRYTSDIIASMVSQSNTLRMYKNNPAVNGYTNGTFKLYNKNGALIMGLILMDSGNIIQNTDGSYGYDYIRDDQTAWYEQEVAGLREDNPSVSSLLFFHIPLQEYINAWDSGIVVFGTKREDVYCSSYHSSLFDKVVQLGSTKAMFVGHDHLNDYGAYYNGIELVYGKSIDYTAYPGIENSTEQRGATLINITSDGNYSIVQMQYE